MDYLTTNPLEFDESKNPEGIKDSDGNWTGLVRQRFVSKEEAAELYPELNRLNKACDKIKGVLAKATKGG